MLRAMKPDEIGGAKVTQGFRMGGRRLLAGMSTDNGGITIEEILKMPAANRTALIEKNYLFVWPKAVGRAAGATPPVEGAQRHVVARGFGRYDVIEGRKLNDEPLDREAAHRMAGLPEPPRKGGDAPKPS